MGTLAAVTFPPAVWPDAGGGGGSGVPSLGGVLGQLRVLTAAGDTALLGFADAAAFAGQVEEAARAVGFLQVLGAAAVDRARKDDPDGLFTGDDGYCKTEDFLRDRLRISAAEAHGRLSLARTVLPRAGITGQPLPALHEELGAAFADGAVPSRSATIIARALARVRPLCDGNTAARMEHALTRTAAEHDPDFLARITGRWVDAIDQDGAEPAEEVLRQLQGVFIRRPRHGLQHESGLPQTLPVKAVAKVAAAAELP